MRSLAARSPAAFAALDEPLIAEAGVARGLLHCPHRAGMGVKPDEKLSRPGKPFTVSGTRRIATYNVNGLRGRLPRVLEWLGREQPDIACLQELKGEDRVFPRAELEDAGYGALWLGQQRWNGVAILARGQTPIESRRGLPGGKDDAQSRYLEAAAHGLLVGCLYLPNGNPRPGPTFDYKLAWFERLIGRAETLIASGSPVVLAGDYNVVPTDELDIYDATSWRKDALLQPESRECFARLLAQGWTDSLRARHPKEKIFTFWDYFRNHWGRNAGLRIDHLLLSPDLAPKLVDTGVDRWVRAEPGASDHAPAWIALDLSATKKASPKKTATKRLATENSTAKQSAVRRRKSAA